MEEWQEGKPFICPENQRIRTEFAKKKITELLGCKTVLFADEYICNIYQ
jgi:hypothetical protein